MHDPKNTYEAIAIRGLYVSTLLTPYYSTLQGFTLTLFLLCIMSVIMLFVTSIIKSKRQTITGASVFIAGLSVFWINQFIKIPEIHLVVTAVAWFITITSTALYFASEKIAPTESRIEV